MFYVIISRPESKKNDPKFEEDIEQIIQFKNHKEYEDWKGFNYYRLRDRFFMIETLTISRAIKFYIG